MSARLLALLLALVALCRGQVAVTDPLDFWGLENIRLPLVSKRGSSWTDSEFRVQGASVMDPYQPGRLILYPEVTPEPDAVWHSRISSSGTGEGLAWASPPKSEHYHWLTREELSTGGPLGKRADLLLSATGQWASQTDDLNSRLLVGGARGRVQVTDRDQLAGYFSGSQIHLSDWGVPAGMEALVGRRLSPSFSSPTGLAGLREADNLSFLQAAWTRSALTVRYSASRARLGTFPIAPGTPSRIDMEVGVTGRTPPLANRAARSRQQLEAKFEPGPSVRHRLQFGGGWQRAGIRNRWSAPPSLITAALAPVSVLALNTPADSRSHVKTVSAYGRDQVRLASWLAASLCLTGDLTRGSTISWSHVSPRAGLTLTPIRRLTLRGSLARLYVPLAGRYLDYGDAASLGGSLYRTGDGVLLARFGGPYSSIDKQLRRPYSDEFNVAAQVALPRRLTASLKLFRHDQKRRIAAVNVGVPASAFAPVQILDPGPDGVAGTFDDQKLTVFAQDPSTLGQDRYLLTNPQGLRMMYAGMVSELGWRSRSLTANASFLAVKSYGPTNPGNGPLENDAGVIGALFQDPNTVIHAAGRTYFDRAYVGKMQVTAALPGGLALASTVDYLDGLAFGRRLLVTGLPQGPFLVAATVRGSPEGGNRAQYVLNWNLRISRRWRSFGVAVDTFNVLNASHKLQESDVSGPLFNQRLPVLVQPPRFLRFTMEYLF